MSSGILVQSATIQPAAHSAVYEVPVGKVATVNVFIVNRHSSWVKTGIALASSSTGWANHVKIAHDMVVNTKERYEMKGIVLQAGMKVWIYGDTTAGYLSVTICGFEDDE